MGLVHRVLVGFLLISLVNRAFGGYEANYIVAIPDNPPDGVVVNPNQPSISVNENLEGIPNNRIAQIRYTDDGAGTPRISFFGNPDPARIPDIDVEKVDGEETYYYLVLRSPLDYEFHNSSYGVQLTPRPVGNILDFMVVDLNDWKPTFLQDGYPQEALPLDENTTLTDPIFTFKAEDLDSVSQGKLLFSLQDMDVQDQNDSPFRIDAVTGVLMAIKELDFENRMYHRLQISVNDTELVTLAPMVTNIEVIDSPDTPPRWNIAPSRIRIDEGPEDGLSWTFHAVDGDSGIRSPITYSLDQNDFFKIDPKTGILTVANEVDADVLDELTFELIVHATEDLNPYYSISETVAIEVRDVNDIPPLILPLNVSQHTFTVRIKEHESESSQLPIEDGGLEGIVIRDLDTTSPNNRYSAKMVVPIGSEFLEDALRVSPLEGFGETTFSVIITDRFLIDYEDPSWRGDLEFTVRFTPLMGPDIEENTAIATIRLNIEDINDNSPEWLNLEDDGYLLFTFEETVGIGYEIGRIEATDADISDDFGVPSLRYGWYGQRRPSNMDIDPVSGLITVTKNDSFNFEGRQEETFFVEVVDMNNATGNEKLRTIADLILRLTDINDEPPTITLTGSQAQIPENSVYPELIRDAIEIRDPDTTADLEVTIQVLTNSPDIDLNTWFTIIDDDPPNPEPGVWRKRLVAGLNPDGGAIDRELFSRVDVVLVVTDKAQILLPNSANWPLSIEILDVNDRPPVFRQNYSDPTNPIRVIETAESDGDSDFEREIFTFEATDPDHQPSLRFELTSDFPRMMELVELEPISGILRRRKGVMIDREEWNVTGNEDDMDLLYYTITVFDNDDVHSTSLDIQISVIDINDNFPFFNEDYSVVVYEVFENVEIDTEIGIIQATDADNGTFGTVQYFFDVSYNEAIGLDKFKINQINGDITTDGDLDREIMDSYTLKVLAKDNYRPGSTLNSNTNDTLITIKIKDRNDNRPEFVSGTVLPAKSEEGVESGDELGEVVVIDKDEEGTPNSEIDFELQGVECSNPNVNPDEYFVISKSENGFKVFVNNTNFKDSYGDYTLTVEASDRGDDPQKTNGFITIKINDINNHPPKFDDSSDRRLFVRESLAVGLPLKEFRASQNYPEIKATDEDDVETPNGQCRFHILPNTVSDYFSVKDERYGLIYIARDLELQREPYRFTLNVTDLSQPFHSDTLNFIIYAVPEDDNNQKPEFASSNLEMNITENEYEEPGVIARLDKATDKDIIPEEDFNQFNEKICYHIIKRVPETDIFSIEENVSELLLKINGPLDREEYDRHELTIYASNELLINPCPPTPNIAQPDNNLTILVNVNDVIDTPPKFLKEGLISGGLKTNADITASIIAFEASDPDLNDEITFEITSDVEVSDESLSQITPPLFTLRADNGQLFPRFQPVAAMKGHFTFTVNAYDKERLTAQAEVKIYMITEANVVKFTFNNEYEFVTTKWDPLEAALSRVFGFRCTIDTIGVFADGNGQDRSKTLVDSHFIDESKSEPVVAKVITDQQFDTKTRERLLNETLILGLSLHDLGLVNNDRQVETAMDKVLLGSLIAGVAVITVVLIVVSVTCWFNSKSLSRRVRALTASTFGSKDSGLNRIGAGSELPNTNQHAIQGSNPIWSKDEEGIPRDFDTESVGSGGSILIGVEDDDDFRNYKGGKSNPMFGNVGDGPSAPNFGGVNPLFQMDGLESDSGDGHYARLDDPKPPPTIRRNPLMNMDLAGESDQ